MLHRSDWPIETTALRFFDIETTGLRPDRGARITEIALVDRGGAQLDWRRERDATDLSTVLPGLFDHLQAGVVVGHNVRFDFRFVAYEADRLGLRGPAVRFIDTLDLARTLDLRTPDVRLGTLLSHFALVPEDTLHTALVDARATRALFWTLVEHGNLETLADAGLKRLDWTTF